MRSIKVLVATLLITMLVGVDGAGAPVHAAVAANPLILEIDLALGDDSVMQLPVAGISNLEVDWDYPGGVKGAGCQTSFTFGTPSNAPITCDYGSATGTVQIALSGSVTMAGTLVANYPGADMITKLVDWGTSLTGFDSTYQMFSGAYHLVDVPNSIPASVTMISRMFQNATSFNDADVIGWDTSHVEFASMLFDSAIVFNRNISGWDVSNMTDMSNMFHNAARFNQDLSAWNVSSAENMVSMFAGAEDFNNGCDPDDPTDTTCPLDWGSDTGNVTTMNGMFSGAVSFNQDVSGWDVANVDDFGGTFSTASSFNNGCAAGVTTCPLTWDTSSATDTQWMFYQADDFNQDISTWDLSGVTLANFMFQNTNDFNNGCASGVFTCDLDWSWGSLLEAGGVFQGAEAFNQNVSDWDTSTLTEMSQLFLYATAFNNGCGAGVFTCPLTWNTSNITDMGGLFQGAEDFNQAVTSFDVWDVTSFDTMFAGAIAFNNGCAPADTTCPMEFTGGNSASLTSVASMFEGAIVFNQNIASWDTADVTTMHYAFSEAAAFNNGCADGDYTCPLNWNTHLVTNMNNTLRLAIKFNQSVSFWDTSLVTDFGALFYSAAVFNNGCAVDDSSCSLDWGTNAATNMYQMFSGAVEFDQNLSMFDTSNVTNMTGMFHSAEKFNHDLSMWDVSAVTSINSMFRSAAVFNQDLSNWCLDESVDIDLYDDLAISWSEPRPQIGACGAAHGGGGRRDTSTTTTSPTTTVPGGSTSLPSSTVVESDDQLPRTGSDFVVLWLTAVALSAGILLLLGRRRLRG